MSEHFHIFRQEAESLGITDKNEIKQYIRDAQAEIHKRLLETREIEKKIQLENAESERKRELESQIALQEIEFKKQELQNKIQLEAAESQRRLELQAAESARKLQIEERAADLAARESEAKIRSIEIESERIKL